MLRRIFVLLVLGGLVAVCPCEPVNRQHLPLDTANVVGCSDDGGDRLACGTVNRTAAETAAPESSGEDQTSSDRKPQQGELPRFLGDSDHAIVSARRRRRPRNGRIILYMVGAMKAALVYGMLHGVAALAGKALLVAKVALAIAIASVLKKNDHEKVSYEIVKHPQHSYIQTHSSSVDYDHRSDYGEDGYDHRKRRRILR